MIQHDSEYQEACAAIRAAHDRKKEIEAAYESRKKEAEAKLKEVRVEIKTLTAEQEKILEEMREDALRYFISESIARNERARKEREQMVREPEANGFTEEAERIKNSPIQVQLPESEFTHVKFRDTFEVTSMEWINREYMKPDDVKIRKAISEFGKDAERIVGGIEVTSEPSLCLNGGKKDA